MADHEPIPVDEVARLPAPGTARPVSLAFAPDGTTVTFLDSVDDTLDRQLHAWDPTTGERRLVLEPPGGGVQEGALSLEEQLRRERMRERGLGITRYRWSREGDTLLVPIAGAVYAQRGLSGALEQVIAEDPPPLSPKLSRDGRQVAWVSDAELYVRELPDGPPRQLTRGARGTGRTHGLAEYIAQEEMDRHDGFWWSRDGTRIAFTEVDETHIPVWRIPHEGRATPSWEDHRYPFAGAENARVRLGVVRVAGGEPVWMDLTAGGALEVEYLARVHWMPDGRLVAEVQDRAQSRLDVVALDPDTGAGRVLLTERSDVWINLHRDFRAFETDRGELAGGFLWASERTGFKHLYAVARDGTVLRQLTDGPWQVDGVAGVDEDRGVVWFTGTRDGATERHLYRVGLAGGPVERITRAPGTHGVVLDPGFERFIDVHHAVDRPPRITLRSLADDAELAVLHEPDDPRLDALHLPPPELLSIPGADGTPLDVAVYRPEGTGPFPTLVHVYGGPHAQMVANAWGLTADMRDQWLRSRGWLVIRADNRGAARRGLAFEGAIRHDLGHLEVEDQAAVVRALAERGLVDLDRVGIFGWSYGGYMAAMALCRAPDVFRAAVAGAPVTHWDGYDTHYTERYMGMPRDNPEGYARSSVMAHVDRLRGRLMLVHGMIDENVHFRHTARLIDALVKAGRRYELLVFPDERHVPRDPEGRAYTEQAVVDFFERALGPP